MQNTDKNEKCRSCPHGCGTGNIKRLGEYDINSRAGYTVALAGNPNTGKSTIFNSLTGLKQHTGNWPGKTVSRAVGGFRFNDNTYKIVDLPGTYSLLSTSEDEEIARNFILFDNPDVTVVVADATRIERNMNLILQILQITDKVILCVNLMDEAKRNRIDININALSRRLGIPVIATSARSYKGIDELLGMIESVALGERKCNPYRNIYLPEQTTEYIDMLSKEIVKSFPKVTNSSWIALRMIEKDRDVMDMYGTDELVSMSEDIHLKIGDDFHENIIEGIYSDAARICSQVVQQPQSNGKIALDARLDRILTSKTFGIPIMILLLAVVFWLTIEGSNYPSSWLDSLLIGWLYPNLRHLCTDIVGMPWWLSGCLIDGVYLSTAWVVSVMLPPMAIFFPLFTLLEDFGYLPRVAFNLDEMFRRSGAHGKQALTMSMGFGCNAAGIVSTRIIDSNRERLIAIITNNFSLCNGRWPTQILIATIFIGASVSGRIAGIVSFVSVLSVAMLGVAITFLSNRILSSTVLKGEVSTFSLELPPYRPPQIIRTIYTSLIDRTLIVLWRAVVFAAPAGALIWLSCNIYIDNMSVAEHLIYILDTPAYFLGLNGIILLAYILAIPANEVVMPTILMLTVLTTGTASIGAGNGVLFECSSDMQTKELLLKGGWDMLTAVNLMIFCLLHHPCSTTIYTIYKETKSRKWTAIATLLPLVLGIVVTFVVASLWRLL